MFSTRKYSITIFKQNNQMQFKLANEEEEEEEEELGIRIPIESRINKAVLAHRHRNVSYRKCW
jgi:hypothetical protein